MERGESRNSDRTAASGNVSKGEKLLNKPDNEEQVRKPIDGKEKARLGIPQSNFSLSSF